MSMIKNSKLGNIRCGLALYELYDNNLTIYPIQDDFSKTSFE